ncbi:MAG: heme o synthase [Polyangiaceae bacterium]|nr:heme o synthase [Polyangiaceae bacterium]
MHEPFAGAIRGAKPAQVWFRDVVALTKPRVTFMVVVTAAGGLLLSKRLPEHAPEHASDYATEHAVTSPLAVFATLLGIALVVAGANALNMYIERDIDRQMPRTSSRPLPAGRMAPRFAFWFGVACSVLAIAILATAANLLTALLALLANLLYVLAYTPMKQRSAFAIYVGAIPGAIPPLLGWTAATGSVNAIGIVLFGVLFLWQVPHFVAIAIFRKTEYERAGLVVLPNVAGELACRHTIVRWVFACVATSLFLVPLGVARHGYLIVASLLGAIFFTWSCYGLREGSGVRWARSLFGVSIAYLVLLFAALGMT